MESFLADLIAEQHKQGMDAHALVHGDPLPNDPAWLHRVPVQLALIFAPIAVGFRQALARAIEETQPDVLHLHMPNNAVFWALTLPSARQIPWVVHWHSDVLVSDSQWKLRWAYSLYRPFEQAVLDQAERIVVTSPPYLQASAPLKAWRDKCDVLPLAFQTKVQVTPGMESVPTWLPERLKVLAIGRLTYYKDFETLIRAVSASPLLQLQIVGAGELMVSLEKLILQLTPPGTAANVQLRGELSEDEKNQLLASCDLLALASCERTEAFGLVLLEAMAHGKPCVVSDLPGSGMPWVVTSSQAGLVLPPGQPKVWREALNALWAQPAQLAQWGRQGREAIHARFSIQACAQAVSAQYRFAQTQPLPTGGQRPLLFVIPAKDEAETIGAVVRALFEKGFHHVFVIDDHSSDGTGDIARAAGATVARPVLPLGAWGGMQLGIRYAVAHGHEAVITMDADGQHEVAEIPALLAAAGQADVVIGAHPARASALRQLAWRWFRMIAGFELRDLTSGFRYYNRDAITLLAQDEATLMDYQDVGVLLLLRKAGLRLVEVPVSMNTRQVGRSRIFNSWLSVLRYMVTTTLLCLARWHTTKKST
jgi:glycosyltransferase involved in cell wall biosynthesis